MEVLTMPGLRDSQLSPHFGPILYGRAEPDDLYDPPPEAIDPYLIDQEDFELEDIEELNLNEDED
jgi:hypothetical protein